MAAVKEDEQSVQPQEISAETPQEVAETVETPPQENAEETPQEPSKPPKERRSILLPVLTVLLVLLGVGEAIFWGYFGFSAYARSLARERYEQQQKAYEEEQASRGIVGGSSYSPNLKVENGTIVWERENWGYAGKSQPANTSTTPRREDGLRLSRLSVVRVPYTLAEMHMDEPLPSQTPAAGLTDSETAPTGA